ncbi:MAG: tRNA (adenosine(37)-N6)-dimethylallyltransferase MiaA [Saprospiraceae bacterium]|nr:tRNA (adenosine(37)-N6)-dimethylallyltransferase MiaA [Saprospiraceae bacterium]
MEDDSKELIVIGGPTGIGKSRVALKLAELLDTEILSADSRQIYRELNIGAAKPPPEDLAHIKHHFIDHLSITSTFTASDFERQGLQILAAIFKKRDFAIVCGGTGFYIHALCHGLDEIPDVDPAVRLKFDTLYNKYGLEKLQEELLDMDPSYFDHVDKSNSRRLIRALSVIEQTGQAYSSFLRQEPTPRPFHITMIRLDEPRRILYEKINKRVLMMIDQGLEDEVRSLLAWKELPALQTVGYQEWFPYFEGQISIDEVIRLIQRNTRHYAKRQSTWFRKHGEWTSFSPLGVNKIYHFIQESRKSRL